MVVRMDCFHATVGCVFNRIFSTWTAVITEVVRKIIFQKITSWIYFFPQLLFFREQESGGSLRRILRNQSELKF